MSLLSAKNLVKSYGGRKVVDNVSLEVNAGEIVGLFGPNGAGKTTSFRMMIGMITPENGRVLFDSEDVTYLHRGIAGRAFERRFELAEHIKVSSANLVNGMLQIELVCEIPEEKKPRSVAIHTKSIPHKKAA